MSFIPRTILFTRKILKFKETNLHTSYVKDARSDHKDKIQFFAMELFVYALSSLIIGISQGDKKDKKIFLHSPFDV